MTQSELCNTDKTRPPSGSQQEKNFSLQNRHRREGKDILMIGIRCQLTLKRTANIYSLLEISVDSWRIVSQEG
ncbi:hypothetical protein ATANTOWER_021225 [Ataeniobius toweri]|uniref:Uncharacterized protein n=1 Tax=Ataeniobius toweri TaxID=208326 RepID=A0ABU7AT57_9TELE|nr:hypothetical protein [Ataeniobius toweri]